MPKPDITPLPIAQHEREMLVGAFLDITLDQWYAFVNTHVDDVPDDLDGHLGIAITSLVDADQHEAQTPDAAVAYQPYLQALAMLSDASLHWIVTTA